MAVSTRSMARQRDYSRLFIALAVVAGIVAIAPIAAAILGVGGASVGPRTAFASAPAGEYAVLRRSEGEFDVIAVARVGDATALTEIARVRRFEGFPSTGSVSRDGKYVALVTVDGGTAAHPIAALNVVALETGKLVRAAENIAPEQIPVWSNDGKIVVVTRQLAGNQAQGPIDVVSVQRDGSGETLLARHADVLGAYPIGYDAESRLATVVLEGSGSRLIRAGGGEVSLSTNLTRDWQLSPDGTELAFIDIDSTQGVRYLARTVRLSGAAVSVQGATAAVVALGAAWDPTSGSPAFGLEPGQSASGVTVQALSASASEAQGFDVPHAFSKSGQAVAVTHWSGDSFAAAGRPELQLVTPVGRVAFEGFTGFLGWSAR